MASELGDTTTTFRAHLIRWANEIQNDVIQLFPAEEMKFKLKKLLPTEQDFMSLTVEKPSAPTATIASGGSLTDGTVYKVYATFVIYDDDTRKYIESELGSASAEATGDSSNKTIDVTAIPTMSGDTDVNPKTIYRNIYVAAKASGESNFAEPFFSSQITDNVSTTVSITSAPSSTQTPPSFSEVDQVASDHMFMQSGNWWLQHVGSNKLTRFSTNPGTSETPSAFDFYGLDGIRLFPPLASSSSIAQRTLQYTVHRRPHEIFYELDREIDLPISCEQALVKGVLWKGYEFRDRAGKESKQINYEQEKIRLERIFSRQKGSPQPIRDVNGGFDGFSI